MKGRYKKKILAAMGMAVMLGGCGEKSGLPDAAGDEPTGGIQDSVLPDADLIVEGMHDRSGIFNVGTRDLAGSGKARDGKADLALAQDAKGEGKAGSALAQEGELEPEGDDAAEGSLKAAGVGQKPEQADTMPEKELLTAEFTTYYGSSSQARCSNIEHAAGRLNGVVIQPGEIFSCSGTIGPVTEENGYLPAGTYAGGKVQEGIGGGVCQISSTLYNAALLAGLTVVERSAHSMVVSYVEPGRDAAIAGDYKDLKLRNDFKYPVVIEASAEEGTLCMVIHTAEEDTGAVVSLVSVIVSETEPGDPIITVDESRPGDYYKVTQKAHTGYVAELYRVTSRNGVEILKEKVNTSAYEAVPEYVTVGGGTDTDE